jgi:RHS repeat-associated protein
MGFTGQYFDAAVGLQYNHHRWYDPSTGRWISEDPIGFAGGDTNLYRYVGNGVTMYLDPFGLQQLNEIEKLFGSDSRPKNQGDKWARTPGAQCDSHSRQKFGFGLEKNVYVDLPNLAASAGEAAISGLEYAPGGGTGVALGRYINGQASLEDVAKEFAFELFYTDEAQRLFRLGMQDPKLALKDDAGKYPRDFPTDNTKKWSSVCKSEGDARNLARTKLGKDPVQIERHKWRSQDGKWQYRAKPGDLMLRHIHLEELNPKTGEVIQNLHLRWPEGAGR